MNDEPTGEDGDGSIDVAHNTTEKVETTPYDFIDPEQYERKEAVQRAVEAKEGVEDPSKGAELKEPGKVGGGSPDSSGIVSRIKTAVGGFFFF